jgi:Uma2 family endonuclease
MREPVVPQLDAEEFLRWEARQDAKFELHDGFVLSFAGGSADHDRISFNLRTILEALYPAPCRSFGTDLKIRVGKSSFYYCDAGVVCSDLSPKATFVETPCVVGEVLSPSTRAYDIVEKRSNYRSMPSIEHYIIVHAELRRVEVDSRKSDGTWSTTCYDDGMAYLGGREISLDAIYARSSLAIP